MLLRVLAMRADQNVYVQQYYRDSIASTSTEDDLRSIPGWTPEPLNVFNGRGVCVRLPLWPLANAARNASSITCRSEHRRSREIFFAFCKSESSIVIVVLIKHQSIMIRHHDIKIVMAIAL